MMGGSPEALVDVLDKAVDNVHDAVVSLLAGS